jgi:hypothetical protein
MPRSKTIDKEVANALRIARARAGALNSRRRKSLEFRHDQGTIDPCDVAHLQN